MSCGAPNAPFNQMSFGVAIEALKFGLAIRRKGWNGKGLWVIKQVPAHIESRYCSEDAVTSSIGKGPYSERQGFH